MQFPGFETLNTVIFRYPTFFRVGGSSKQAKQSSGFKNLLTSLFQDIFPSEGSQDIPQPSSRPRTLRHCKLQVASFLLNWFLKLRSMKWMLPSVNYTNLLFSSIRKLLQKISHYYCLIYKQLNNNILYKYLHAFCQVFVLFI